jgi:hypothetical protein
MKKLILNGLIIGGLIGCASLAFANDGDGAAYRAGMEKICDMRKAQGNPDALSCKCMYLTPYSCEQLAQERIAERLKNPPARYKELAAEILTLRQNAYVIRGSECITYDRMGTRCSEGVQKKLSAIDSAIAQKQAEQKQVIESSI